MFENADDCVVDLDGGNDGRGRGNRLGMVVSPYGNLLG